jgi:hypothetical protein
MRQGPERLQLRVSRIDERVAEGWEFVETPFISVGR